MPPVEDKTFRLKWIVKGFSICVAECEDCFPLVTTDAFSVEALGCTQWRMQLCSRQEDGESSDNEFLQCMFQGDWAKEHGDISLKFSATLLGKDGLVLNQAKEVIYEVSPKQHISIYIPQTNELLLENLVNDQLVICYQIQQITPDARDDTSSGLWKDELKVLSDDMRKLLESGYQSDVALKSSDGRLIPVHFSILFARWKKLKKAVKARPRRPRVVFCPRVSGPILEAFVFYLYTGKIPASDVTIGLFEYVVAILSSSRVLFYTLPREMSVLSIGQKENIAFTWWYEGGGAHFHRALPLQEKESGEILVDISTIESYLDIRFSLSEIVKCVQLNCKATLVSRNGRFSQSADHRFKRNFVPWRFPDFIPMNLLNDCSGGIRMEFELSVSKVLDFTFIESTVTEFQTGSRDVQHVEMLASGLGHLFMEKPFLDLCDVELRTEDGFFRGCKSVLGIRSDVLRKLFRYYRKRSCVRLKIQHSDSKTLSSVLEYLYTGWTNLGSIGEALNIYSLAVGMSVHGLARKCEQYMSASVEKCLL